MGRVLLVVGYVFILVKGRLGMCWIGFCVWKIKLRIGMLCKCGDWGCGLGLGYGCMFC